MKEIQTPRSKDIILRRPKESPSSKSFSDQSKKHQKITKKSLNAEFASVSEDFLTESVSESINLSSISENLSDEHCIRESESFESSTGTENQSIVTSEEAFTPISKITTVCDESVNLSPDRIKMLGSNSSSEVDVAVNLLKQARSQVISSSDVSATSKKLLDALVEASVRDFCALPDEGDIIDAVLSKKVEVVAVCFVFWLISVTIVILFRCSGTRGSASFNPQPT
ncbi:hypothetical protein SOVF_058720 [Spinacia oleracea]|uniref:Uncharacterized protein n=1 Tax=Spinacia oleracea TaxID=3562 RepID=A0A9R0J9U8_SPIOL|nr:uncharacterized protein LOC110801489 [Spinacia oleracea]KNA19741.1 hypothetical protein SOVF_058720 [Spinacia oleracea]